MKINTQTSLLDIQSAFNAQFPHLRLEFYKKAHVQGEATSDREKLNPDHKVNQVAGSSFPGDLDFQGDMQINSLESLMEEKFGLHAQVFRRSGNLWLQTTATDSWSLNEANRKGGHSERLYHEQSNNKEL